MELYSHTEVCRIVQEYLKQFMLWEGRTKGMSEILLEEFVEQNPKIKFKREIRVEEINVEDLDDDSTV